MSSTPVLPPAAETRESDLAALVSTFVKLADKALRQGLLSLEEEMAGLAGDDLRDALAEVIDGTPPEQITELMEYRIEELRERREAELRREVKRLHLITTGVLAVQQGHAPRLVRDLLEARIPPTARAPRPPAYAPPPRPSDAPAADWTEEDLAALSFESVLALSPRDMGRLMRELDAKDVALALRGASEEVQHQFFRAMSSRAAAQIREDMEIMGPQGVSAIDEAKNAIVQVMRRMAEAKRIGSTQA